MFVTDFQGILVVFLIFFGVNGRQMCVERVLRGGLGGNVPNLGRKGPLAAGCGRWAYDTALTAIFMPLFDGFLRI